MTSALKVAAPAVLAPILVGIGWWLYAGAAAGIIVGGITGLGALGVVVWSLLEARGRRDQDS